MQGYQGNRGHRLLLKGVFLPQKPAVDPTQKVHECCSQDRPSKASGTKSRNHVDAHWGSPPLTEEYAVRQAVMDQVLSIMPCKPALDAFALRSNARFRRFWGPDSWECQDAFTKSWDPQQVGVIWANPPFSLMGSVVKKIKTDGAHVILTAPQWDSSWWWQAILDMSVVRARIQAGSNVFTFNGEDIGPTRWPVTIALLCPHNPRCEFLTKDRKRKARKARVQQRCEGRKTEDDGMGKPELRV